MSNNKPTYELIDPRDVPDMEHQLHVGGGYRPAPVEKTEAEINRMWEYNKMMGRR